MEIRYLTAPKLNDNNLGNKIIGYRPCRHGPPRIEIEKKSLNGKVVIIANNYGHAGSGWTLSPAVVYYLNNILIEAIKEDERSNKFIKKFNLNIFSINLKEKLKIYILGAGVIGLFTAYDLVKKGGLLAPFALEIDDCNEKVLIEKFCIETYNFYKEIAEGKNVDFPSKCAEIKPAYVDNTSTKNFEPYIAAKVMKPPKQVLVQFDTCPNKQKKMFVFDDAILVQPYEIMNKLCELINKSGNVNFIKKRIESFEKIKEADLIINCTGIGAKKLCSDEKMYLTQGHLINLKEQKEECLNYMIICHGEAGISQSGQTVERPFYIFPKRNLPCLTQTTSEEIKSNIGVIGGTFVRGNS